MAVRPVPAVPLRSRMFRTRSRKGVIDLIPREKLWGKAVRREHFAVYPLFAGNGILSEHYFEYLDNFLFYYGERKRKRRKRKNVAKSRMIQDFHFPEFLSYLYISYILILSFIPRVSYILFILLRTIFRYVLFHISFTLRLLTSNHLQFLLFM